MTDEQPSLLNEPATAQPTTAATTEAPAPEAPKEEPKEEPKQEPPKEEAKPYSIKDITLPDGFAADAPTQEAFVKIVNDHKLSREAAAALVELQAGVMKQAS